VAVLAAAELAEPLEVAAEAAVEVPVERVLPS